MVTALANADAECVEKTAPMVVVILNKRNFNSWNLFLIILINIIKELVVEFHVLY